MVQWFRKLNLQTRVRGIKNFNPETMTDTHSSTGKYKKTLEDFTAATSALLYGTAEPQEQEAGGETLIEKRHKRLDRVQKQIKTQQQDADQDKRERKLLYEQQHVIPDPVSTLVFETRLKKLAKQGAVQVLNAIEAARKKQERPLSDEDVE